MGQAKVKVVEEALENKPQELWKRWGWRAVQRTPQHTVLEGCYRTPRGEIRGRVEIISAAGPVQIRFYIWDGQQQKFRPRCMRASSVEQGILTLQAVLSLHRLQRRR